MKIREVQAGFPYSHVGQMLFFRRRRMTSRIVMRHGKKVPLGCFLFTRPISELFVNPEVGLGDNLLVPDPDQ
jgi:hypothetical protein